MVISYERVGTGEPLVLIHGIGSQWQVWRPLFEHLAPRRDVIAVDLPGFGESAPLPGGEEPTAARFAEAVIELLDALGVERPVVAGNSLGGWTSLEVARRGRARAAAPISPAGFGLPRERAYAGKLLRFDREAAKLVVAAHAIGLVRNPVTRTALFAGMIGRPWLIPPDDAAGMLENLAGCPGYDATLNMLNRMTFAGGDEIRVPVVLIWGTHDFLLIPRQAYRAQRVLPDARIEWLKGAGHVPTYDAPAEIARHLLAL